MKMEAVLTKTEDMAGMPTAWTQEEAEDDDAEYPDTFHDSDDENPPDDADRRGRGARGRGGGIKILKTSYCGSVRVRENDENVVQKMGNPERESSIENPKEREPGGGGGGGRRNGLRGRLRHRCFLNNCCGETRGEAHQLEDERGYRGGTMNSGRENDVEKVITNPDNNGNDSDKTQQTNTNDGDSARGCVTRQRTSSPTPATPHLPAAHTLPPCHCIPQQSYRTHPCQCCHPPLHPFSPCLQYHKQGTAFPYQTHGFHCIPCQIPYMCPNPQHPQNHPATRHNRGNVIQAIQETPAAPADASAQERRARSQSFSKDYITSLAFLARVNHVAKVLADRTLPVKDLSQCPSPAMCLLLPQQCQESSPHHDHRHQDSTQDLQRLQETLALCTGVGKGEVTPDLRQYCRSLLLAVLCPRSPPHEVLLVENSIQELEGRAYGDHRPSQVKYCWRLASSLCLILERLDWVPSAQ